MIQIDDLELWTLDQIASYLGLPRRKLDELVRDGELVAVMHGGRLLVDWKEIESFKDRWTPPVRASRAGVTTRFIPPPRPADPSWECCPDD